MVDISDVEYIVEIREQDIKKEDIGNVEGIDITNIELTFTKIEPG